MQARCNNKRNPGSGCTYQKPTWLVGKSPFLIGDTSSNWLVFPGCFHCHAAGFRGVPLVEDHLS